MKGELVGGSLDKKKVKEYVVFERMISDPNTEWRICKTWTCVD